MEQLLVGIDIGCRRHRVAVGMPDGTLIDQFDLDHQPASFDEFFYGLVNRLLNLNCSGWVKV